MGKDKDYITVEITIEQAVKALAREFREAEKTVIIAMANQMLGTAFAISYEKWEVTIPDQESVHVEGYMYCGVVIRHLLEVAEKGWKNVYVSPNDCNAKLITKTKDKKGRVIIPKKEIKTENPETGEEEIICIQREVRDIKRVVEKYTGEHIPFREFKAKITLFEELREKNSMPIPDYWLDENPEGTQVPIGDSLGTICKMENLQWHEVKITITEIGVIIISARGVTARITNGAFGLYGKTTGKPNKSCELLFAFAAKQPVFKSRKMAVKRLRDLLKNKIRINKAPIVLDGQKYKTKFKIAISDYKQPILIGGKFTEYLEDPMALTPEQILINHEQAEQGKIASGGNYDVEHDETDDFLAQNDPTHPDYK